VSRALAIDIGGTKTLVGLVEGGRVIEQRRSATNLAAGAEGWLDAIYEATRGWKGFDCVGAAVTGVIMDGRWSAVNPEILPVPDAFPLQRALADRFAAPAACFNDAQAAAWGEHTFGAGQNRDLVFVTISTGIGGGAVVGGRLLVGRSGLGGSAGQVRAGLDLAAPRVEDVCSGRWMAGAAAAAGRPVDAEGVFRAAAQGESWAQKILSTSVDAAANLLVNLQLLFDPPQIVIGGGIGLAPGYLAALQDRLARQPAILRPDLKPAALGAASSLIGAADLALNERPLKE